MMQKAKPKVLFLCTGNSCRSQMAEGWARALIGDQVEAYSAGTKAKGLNPNAVWAMSQQGVDISQHRSKTVADLLNVEFDYVFTVCNHAHDNCPVFPGEGIVINNLFDDPPALAAEAANEAEGLAHYSRVCGEIRDWVKGLPEFLARSA